jgi:hypothetical protein
VNSTPSCALSIVGLLALFVLLGNNSISRLHDNAAYQKKIIAVVWLYVSVAVCLLLFSARFDRCGWAVAGGRIGMRGDGMGDVDSEWTLAFLMSDNIISKGMMMFKECLREVVDAQRSDKEMCPWQRGGYMVMVLMWRGIDSVDGSRIEPAMDTESVGFSPLSQTAFKASGRSRSSL